MSWNLISRDLHPDDFEWALNNSRRKYRVRLSTYVDEPRTKSGMSHGIGIIRICDGHKIFLSAQWPPTALGPWRDTDAWAEGRLAAYWASCTANGRTPSMRPLTVSPR